MYGSLSLSGARDALARQLDRTALPVVCHELALARAGTADPGTAGRPVPGRGRRLPGDPFDRCRRHRRRGPRPRQGTGRPSGRRCAAGQRALLRLGRAEESRDAANAAPEVAARPSDDYRRALATYAPARTADALRAGTRTPPLPVLERLLRLPTASVRALGRYHGTVSPWRSRNRRPEAPACASRTSTTAGMLSWGVRGASGPPSRV